MLLIGRGELLEEIKRKVKNLDLEDKVYFLGVRNDVPDLLNAMDVFILPSRFEGLPVTLVEIQANGLCSFVSDAVTKEICIAGNMHYIGLNQEASVWAKAVLSSDVERENVDIAAAGYDIDTAAAEIKEKYRALKKREEESS